MTNTPQYHERLKRFNTAPNKGTPDIVPVFPIIKQWVQLVTGISIRDSYLGDPMFGYEAFRKVHEKFQVKIHRKGSKKEQT